MENKRLYKKLDTYFWFFMMALPILFALISFIFVFFSYDKLPLYTENYDSDYSFAWIIENFNYSFSKGYIWNFIDLLSFDIFTSMFNNLFTTISISGGSAICLSPLCSYWVSLGFIHLIVDICLWLPNLFHKWLNKERF